METNNKSTRLVAIVAMIFLFGMIAFVTNLAAPIGVIWKNQPALKGSNTLGMLGNMMNFLAYLFFGIPSGKMLQRRGYKTTALVAVACGFAGVFIQYLSGVVLTHEVLFGLPANFYVYLLGAFVAGISVCILNTVVNPMLNLLGGGGNKGNQLILIGGTLNSFLGCLTPMLVGALIGQITPRTAISDVNLVLFMAMAVFAVTFVALSFIPIADPVTTTAAEDNPGGKTPWSFPHFYFGVIAIFVYVGTEVGIPGTLNFYLSNTSSAGAGLNPLTAASIGGFAAGTYWLMMLIGRTIGGFIGGKVSSRTMMAAACTIGIVLLVTAILSGSGTRVSIPLFTSTNGFQLTVIPLSALLLILCGLCTSVMWSSIFNMATEGLGSLTAQASGIFMTMVVGGGVLPILQNYMADHLGYLISYTVPLIAMVYMLVYALWLSKK